METTEPTETLTSTTTPSRTRSRHFSGGKTKNVDFNLPESSIPQHLLDPELMKAMQVGDNVQPAGSIPRDKRSHSPMFGRRRRKSSRDVGNSIDAEAAKVNGLQSAIVNDVEQNGENAEVTGQKKSLKTLLFGRNRVASKPVTISDLPDVGELIPPEDITTQLVDCVPNGKPQMSEKTEAATSSTTSGARHRSLLDRFKLKKVDVLTAGVNRLPSLSDLDQISEDKIAAVAAAAAAAVDASEIESNDSSSTQTKSTLRKRFGRHKTSSKEEFHKPNAADLQHLEKLGLHQVLPLLESEVEGDPSLSVVPVFEPSDDVEHAVSNLKRSRSKRPLFLDKMQAKMVEQKHAMQSAIDKVNENISGTIDDIKATQQRLKDEFEAENQRIIGNVKDRIKKDFEAVGDFKNSIKRELKEVINTIKKEILAIVNGILLKIFMVIGMVALFFLFAIIGLIWTIRTVAQGEDRIPPTDEVAQSFLHQQMLEFEQLAAEQVHQRSFNATNALYCSGYPYKTINSFCT